MKKITLCVVWFIIFAMTGFGVPKNTGDSDIPLVWNPSETVRSFEAIDLTVYNNVRFMIKPFKDARKRPAEIGVNIESEDEELLVTTGDNVAEWLTDRFSELFVALDVDVVDKDGSIILQAEIIRFFVTEKATYKAEVELKIRLLSTNNDVLWEGMARGKATRFGRSFTAENYNEALSNATIYAVHSLLRDEDFINAVKRSLPI